MASQPFVPKEGEEVTFSFAPTPTYLFRLYTPKSAGRTNAKHVSPPAYLNRPKVPHRTAYPCGLDLLKLPPEIAAWRLSDHLLWKCGGGCNLMSWSSSLLLVLQYALYRHKHWRDRSSLSEIFIIIIDTRGFPQRTFLRDLDALEYYPKLIKLDDDLEKLKGWRVLGGDKYFGEYLTQGYLEIEGHCCRVSMQQLIDTGLFKLCTFSDWNNWANPVLDIRRDSFSTEETDHEQVRLAISMGVVNMEPRFAFPFAAMLLSLHARDTKHESVRTTFHAMFTEEELNAVDITYDADVYETKIRLKEVEQFKRLVEAIREKKSVDSVDQISQTFQRLSVANTAQTLAGPRRVRRIPYPQESTSSLS